MRKMTAIRQSAPKKKKQRVAAYCRVSTDRTEQQHSFEMQRMYYAPFVLRAVLQQKSCSLCKMRLMRSYTR